MKKITQADYEVAFKKLLMMNQMGVYLMGRDGHVWIELSNEDERHFQLFNISLNNKIYGGVLQAIETFDEALIMDGQESLMNRWKLYGEEALFLGSGGVDASRLDVVADGTGGLC